jgi:hypothetical protein
MQPVAPSEPSMPTPPGEPTSSVDWLHTPLARLGAGGVVAVALSYLLQFIGGNFNAALTANTEKVNQVAAALATHQSAMETAQAAARERERRELGLLRAICLGVNHGNRAAEQLCAAE